VVIFKKLRFKNFLSTGDQFIEIDLNSHPTTLVIGENGAGKSTFLDALTYALFGKSFRGINKPLLVNSINQRDMLVEVEFTIGKIPYFIRRGIKPNIFEIYIKGKLVDQDSKIKDYQTHLEQNILKLNYKSFCQVVILGSSNFVPFMQLSAADRRFIIEDLLDIQIFSQMNTILKEKVSEIKDQLNTIDNRVEIETEKIKIQEKYLRDIKADNKNKITENKTKIKENKDNRKEFTAKIKVLQKEVNELLKDTHDCGTLKSKIDKLDHGKHQALTSLTKLTTDITFFESTEVCNTCKQSIDDAFRTEMIAKKKIRIAELNKAVNDANKKIEVYRKNLFATQDVLKVIQNKELEISRANSSIAALDVYISKIQDEIESLQNKKTKTKGGGEQRLTDLRKELSNLEKQKAEIVEKRYHYDLVSIMLKDSGIKTRIIKQYLPIMNKLVNKYLNQMDFFVNFNLDENFKEVIKSRGRDEFSYESFSEGEKTRINLAILFAWRTVARLKNSANTNILIFDEIMDSSLDNEGLDDFIKMVHDISGSNTKVMIISHRNAENMLDKFSSVIRFDKVKNFSQMTVIT
jgi:Kyanoviridae SbcC-like subunit of palindrome specific endonuclease